MADDNVLNLETRVMTGPLEAGMNQAATVVKESTSAMASGFSVAQTAALAFTENLKLYNQALTEGGERAKIWQSVVKDATNQGLDFGVALSIARKEAEAFAPALEADAAAAAHTVPEMAAASAAVRELNGQLSVRAAERFLTTTLQLGPVLSAAFPIFGALALMDVLVRLADTMSKQIADLLVYTDLDKQLYAQQVDENNQLINLNKQLFDLKEENFKHDHNAVENSIHDLERVGQNYDQLTAQVNTLTAQLEGARQKAAELAAASAAAVDPETGIALWNKELEQANNQVTILESKLRLAQKAVEVGGEAEVASVNKVTDAQEKAAELRDKANQKAADDAEKIRQREEDEVSRLTDKRQQSWQRYLDWKENQDEKAAAKAERLEEQTAEAETRATEALLRYNQKVAAIQEESAKAHAEALKAITSDRINFEEKMGTISIQKGIELQKTALKTELADELAALKAKEAMYAEGTTEFTRAKAEEVKAVDKYNREIAKLDQQAALARTQLWRTMSKTIASDFTSGISGMITQQETLAQATSKLFQGLLNDVVNYLAQMLERWILTHIFMMGSQVTTAEAQITSESAVGAAAAYASTAAIPIIGPELAPASAAVAMSDILGFLSVGAFEKGGIHAQDGLAYLHKKEMTLPEHLSTGIQDLIAGGGGTGLTINMPVQTMDSASFATTVRGHARVIAKTVTDHLIRNGMRVNKR